MSEDLEQSTQRVDKYNDVSHYRHRRMASERKRGIRIAIICVLALILLAGAGTGIYVANINAKLSENITTELREQLVETTAGEPFYLLLLGVDKDEGRVEDTEHYGEDESAYRSDSIMLCRVDPKNVKVTMVSIHRDTAINMDEHGVQKINAAYAFGGPAYTTQVVSEFAGVPISHYAEVDLDRFISIVDQVGGVTVDLPVPVYDPEYTGLDLPEGVQTLDGTEAALLCRCRHGYDQYGDGDRYRAANQRMVFSEIIKKVLASDPATMAATVATMAESVTTDLEIPDILDLASQMSKLDVESDIYTGMEPTDGVFTDGAWYEACLVDQWKKMMMRIDQGLPPYDEDSGEQDSTSGVAGAVGTEGTPSDSSNSSEGEGNSSGSSNSDESSENTESTEGE
ncbi:MAG: LCP family protein [Coriobacteriales bacterium]|nr:LCP family protein [Coriobacteriales bacterium]